MWGRVYESSPTEDTLAHFGVKGMRWGVRKADRTARNQQVPNYPPGHPKHGKTVGELKYDALADFIDQFASTPKSSMVTSEYPPGFDKNPLYTMTASEIFQQTLSDIKGDYARKYGVND